MYLQGTSLYLKYRTLVELGFLASRCLGCTIYSIQGSMFYSTQIWPQFIPRYLLPRSPVFPTDTTLVNSREHSKGQIMGLFPISVPQSHRRTQKHPHSHRNSIFDKFEPHNHTPLLGIMATVKSTHPVADYLLLSFML